MSPYEPRWALLHGQHPKATLFGFCKKYKTFACREQGAETFLCLSLLCCFICSWGEGTLYCQRPWSHVSNPDPDLKCLKCQIFHFHILCLGHLVFVDIQNNNNNNSNIPDQSVQSAKSTPLSKLNGVKVSDSPHAHRSLPTCHHPSPKNVPLHQTDNPHFPHFLLHTLTKGGFSFENWQLTQEL